VPKGYTRFLGKLSELTDMGVEVHFFTGNHDIWCGDYLTRECGVVIHREPLTTEIYGKEFYLAHGDGLGDPDKKFKLLRTMFHSRTLQTLFSTLHPRWSVEFGLRWAKHSRLKRIDGKEPDYMGENNEHLVLYTKEYLKNHPNINFFIYGHRHIELDLMLSSTARVLILGDWINYFSLCRIRRREPVSGRVYRRGNQTVNHLPRLSRIVYSYKRLRKRTKTRNFLPGCL